MEEEFEFDPEKSAANREKHGIDFIEARVLWNVLAFDQPSPFLNEPRRLRTGKYGSRLWTAVYKLRGETVRLISVRRARTGEIASHDRAIADGTGADQEP